MMNYEYDFGLTKEQLSLLRVITDPKKLKEIFLTILKFKLNNELKIELEYQKINPAVNWDGWVKFCKGMKIDLKDKSFREAFEESYISD